MSGMRKRYQYRSYFLKKKQPMIIPTGTVIKSIRSVIAGQRKIGRTDMLMETTYSFILVSTAFHCLKRTARPPSTKKASTFTNTPRLLTYSMIRDRYTYSVLFARNQ